MLKLAYRPDLGIFDLVDDGDGYAVDDTFETAELVAVTTERRARDAQGIERGGWWADPELGSRLWTLAGQPLNRSTIAKARGFVLESLQAWLQLGIAREINVIATQVGPTSVAFDVSIARPEQVPRRWKFAWDATTGQVTSA